MKKAAIPLANGRLTMHFGHCAEFALVDFNEADKSIGKKEVVTAPPHEPGLLPKWLGERGVNLILAGGMGQRAQQLFAERGIHVVTGAPSQTPEELLGAYMNGTLVTGKNSCDH